MKWFTTALVLSLATCAFAEKQSFDRYQSIIDRQPFGQPPAGFDPQRMASEVTKGEGEMAAEQLTQEQEQIQKAVSFSMLNVEANGSVMVGFSDRTNPKAPRHYYLAVGDTQDGWLVKACDPSAETMTIEKDSVEVTLKLGENSAGGAAAPAKAGGATRGLLARGNRPTTLQAPTAGGVGGAGGVTRGLLAGSPLGRRARREMRERADAKARADAAAAEKERKLQDEERAQREAAEKAERERERAEQRQQLIAIQEELRKAREEKERQRAAEQQAEGVADEAHGE